MQERQAEFEALAVYAHQSRDAALVSAAARDAGLTVLDLPRDPGVMTVVPAPGVAWRCPLGLAMYMQDRGLPLPVTAAPATWFAGLPTELTGRRLQVLTVQELLTAKVELSAVALVKLAELNYRHFPATQVRGVEQARSAVAGLPPATQLLIAGRWLDCHSEYRVFCAAERALTCSPYRIDDELWSTQLWMHRASFHDEAQAFVARALAELAPQDRPPGCVLDVARLDNGRLVLLEVNTSWGAGLYGCDPHAGLVSVLAANVPAGPRWSGRTRREPPPGADKQPGAVPVGERHAAHDHLAVSLRWNLGSVALTQQS